MESGEGNVFYETNLGYGEKTELFFKNTIAPPDLGIACLDFKYRKFSKGVFTALITAVKWEGIIFDLYIGKSDFTQMGSNTREKLMKSYLRR